MKNFQKRILKSILFTYPKNHYLDRKLNLENSIAIEPFSEFFEAENYFDINHLNRKCADIFTEQIALSFNENYNSNKNQISVLSDFSSN